MKKPLFLTLYGVVLFTTGYGVARLGGEPEKAGAGKGNRTGGAVTRAAGDRAAARGGEEAPGGEEANGEVRAFTPGRPFKRGQAREWIQSLRPSLEGDRALRFVALSNLSTLFLTMDGDSTREALAALQALSEEEDARNPARRRNPNGDGKLDELLTMTMARMAHTSPEEAIQALMRNFEHSDGEARMLIFGRLTEDDPARAEQLALSLEKGQQKHALECMMVALTSKDPQAALALAGRHEGVLDSRDQEHILESWARRDPVPAMAAAVAEMGKSGNPELVRQAIEEWYKMDPVAAAQWASTHEGTGSVTARAMILERRARNEPVEVLAEYAALQQAGGEPRELARLTSALADSLADKDLGAAREWAQGLPEGDLKNRAFRQVAEQWVKTDAPGASEWIRSLPAGDLRDQAARELTGQLSRRDPVSAFEWARSIGDEKLRGDALEKVLGTWKEQDPDAARAAAESLPAGTRPGK